MVVGEFAIYVRSFHDLPERATLVTGDVAL